MYTPLILTTLLVTASCNISVDVCGGNIESGVGDADQTEIIDTHNYYRQQIAIGNFTGQPKASNMLKMAWDTKLAIEAQKIADTCEFKHVKVIDSRFPVGQNLWAWSSTGLKLGASWKSAIRAWFNEVNTYKFGTTDYNHYTQVVWANTYLVGCGYKYYNTTDPWAQKLNVCNYGPAGNILGQTPYKVGDGCENLCEKSTKI